MKDSNTIIGLISDTHGLLRPEAVAALNKCDYIIHAGDIGSSAVLEALSGIAETFAIRGNIDKEEWAAKIPEQRDLQLAGIDIHVLHDVKQLDFAPEERNIRVVVAGHSHQPLVREKNGVLFVNPSSAGPRRFKLPVCVGYLVVTSGRVKPEITELPV